MTQAKIITVDIVETENGLFRATSEDMLALHVTARDIDSLKSRAKSMIRDLFMANGQDISVFETEQSTSGVVPPWVIVPSDTGSLAY